jgi:hypothetical protein
LPSLWVASGEAPPRNHSPTFIIGGLFFLLRRESNLSWTRVNFEGWTAWNPFHFETTVAPNTTAYLYFLVYNLQFPPGVGNGTGFRLEFTSADLTPE